MRVPIQDPAAPELAHYRDLRDVQLRKSLEAEHGLFIAEGEKVIRRALAAGHQPRSFLLAERWLEALADVIDETVPVYVTTEAIVEAVTGFHVHRGALAAFERPAPLDPEAILSDARSIVVCEDIVDHTNVGAILRSAAGLGFDGAILSPRCADPLYRRSIKVAMGAVFTLPWARLGEWPAAMDLLRSHGFTSVALTLAEDAVPIQDAVAGVDRLALVLGSEGPGLSHRWQSTADRRGIIEMSAGVDSLNVAAAAAVACWVAARR